jgi:four helix bundle protein
MQRFTDIRVWQRSDDLALKVYQATGTFNATERFGLTSLLRRAAVSVPTNIAEGPKRRKGLDHARFLNIAERSLAETENLLMLSRDLAFITEDKAAPLLNEVSEISRMLSALRTKVEDAVS